jgi:hypothetical protein
MSRYFFRVQDAWGDANDDSGIELPDLGSARSVALAGARSMICEAVMKGVLDLEGQITICDETGAALTVVRFADAVEGGRVGASPGVTENLA